MSGICLFIVKDSISESSQSNSQEQIKGSQQCLINELKEENWKLIQMKLVKKVLLI